MPTTVNVLSWNIESLGDAKALRGMGQKSKLIKYLQYAVELMNADVVGIMELKGNAGGQVRDWLLAKLNNARPGPPFAYTWQARLSTRQDGGTQEEYLLLWKDQPNRLTLNPAASPGPTWLTGVVDDNALESFLAQFPAWTVADKANFYAALANLNYMVHGTYRARGAPVQTATWRVGLAQWHALSGAGAGAAVNFAGANPAPPAGINAAQLQQLAQILLDIDVLRFVTYGDRSPYIGHFQVGNPAQALTLGLLHAPGPSDPTRTDAINVMALSAPLAAAPNLLLMGDFNIAQNQAGTLARVYGRYLNIQNQFVFARVVPSQTQPVFGPIAGAPLNAPDQIGNTQTSLVNTYLPDAAPIADALANTYDKFFFRGTVGQMASANPMVLNPIVAMASNQGASYSVNLGTAGLTFFRAFRGAAFLNSQDGNLLAKANKLTRQIAGQQKIINAVNLKLPGVPAHMLNQRNALMNRRQTATHARNGFQNRLNEVNAERVALAAVLALNNNAPVPSPTGIGTSHAVYRHAVSDHLPIRIQLNTP